MIIYAGTGSSGGFYLMGMKDSRKDSQANFSSSERESHSLGVFDQMMGGGNSTF